MENPAVHRALSRCGLVARLHLDAIGMAQVTGTSAKDFTSCAVPVYHVPSRGKRLRLALSRAVPEWESDHGVGVNCKHTFHRGIILAIAALRTQFGVNVADQCWELQ